MARITRCTNCFNPIYEDAAVCPHCNVGRTPATRPRFLTRRSWVFIFVVLALFTVGDTFAVLKEKKEQAQRAVTVSYGEAFLTTFFRGEKEQAADHLQRNLDLADDLDDIRRHEELKHLFPADDVRIERMRDRGTRQTWHTILGMTFRQRAQRYEYRIAINKGGKWWLLTGFVLLNNDRGPGVVCGLEVNKKQYLGDKYTPRRRRRRLKHRDSIRITEAHTSMRRSG